MVDDPSQSGAVQNSRGKSQSVNVTVQNFRNPRGWGFVFGLALHGRGYLNRVACAVSGDIFEVDLSGTKNSLSIFKQCIERLVLWERGVGYFSNLFPG